MSNYSFSYMKQENTQKYNFNLHSHDEYEIYMYVKGDTSYIVDGKNYSLEPYDIIIIRKGEMHRAFHKSNAPYTRVVLMVNPDFFTENNCREYEKQFTDTSNTVGNKINAELVRSSGLYDAFERIRKYSNNFKNYDSPVCKAIVTEILYIIDNISSFTRDDIPNKQIKNIINYINNNYTHDIGIDDISNAFYISKYHLCRIFRKATGLTIHEYITEKRIGKVRELTSEGLNLTDAVMNAGFNSYSSYYRTHIKLYGTTPSKSIK